MRQPLYLSGPQVALLQNGDMLLALPNLQKCCMAKSRIKAMKTNLSPTSTHTRMRRAVAGRAGEPGWVGGRWPWQKDNALCDNGGKRAWTWCLLSQRLEPELLNLTYNYGDARERKRETVFGHQANSQQRCPTWGGGAGGGDARMATPRPPQASLVWLSPGSLWTTAPRRCQNIDRTCRKKKSSCSVLSPWCAAGEAEHSHTRHDSLPRTQATSSPSGFEPRSNSRVYGH